MEKALVTDGTMEPSDSSASCSPEAPHRPERTPKEEREQSIRGIRWFLICTAIFSANFLYGLDTTIVADIQAPISATFQNVAQLEWLGIGFTLGSAVLILPLGKAFGTFDNKRVFIACLLNFAVASALCGAAPNMDAMIVKRVWAGAGGAGMYLGSKEQALYVGVTGFVYGSGCIIGSVVGGLLADSSATRRWAFYLNLVIFGAISPIYVLLLPSVPKKPDLTIWEKTKTMDWLDILLCAGMFSCFTIAFTFSGILWEYNNGRTITLIVVFAMCAVAFAITQYYSIPTTETNRLGAALFVSIYYIPLYYLFVDGDTGTEAAVRLLPYICCYIISVLICGGFMAKTHTSNASISGYTVLLGLGMTCSQAPYAVDHVLVPSRRASELIQYINISQGSSQLIGLAIASAIFQGLAFDGMQMVLGPGYTDKEIRGAITGARSEVLERTTPQIRAISNIWLMATAAGALWTVCSLFLHRARFLTPKKESDEAQTTVDG
ncbi:MFS general substrate transporter [Karstenula rhodostoma CBS 690.94]|uniref:MFS general substrate transporter n=1 Tax=Karstenula rhodostoma CBS 690.94 TaxID=1392251 RepID=A0A9P4PL43_9PLEO|nr:MFS general substrate transporter [Karstenula rhodostoma CBS 690.94]